MRVAARDRGAQGFTLIELMVTLAVAAILLMIAVPSMRHVLASTQLAGINNALVGDLQYARTEAVSRQVRVVVAASTGHWQNGWVVRIPSTSTAASAVPQVLRVHAAVPGQFAVSAASTAANVAYLPQGSLANPATANGTCFTIHATSGYRNAPHYLRVLPAGMLQQTTSDSTTPLGCTSPP